MKIIEVNTPKQAQSFIDLPKFIYKLDPQWVCPLDIEIENVFDPTKNSFYSHGEAIRFLLIDENGHIDLPLFTWISDKNDLTKSAKDM